MISFNCPKCTKAFIVSTKSAGIAWQCKECGQDFTVPEPTPHKSTRWPRRLFILACLSIIAGAAGFWTLKALRPTLIRNRFAADITSLSPNWQGLEWQECDVARESYKITVYHQSDHETYAFEVACSGGGAQTIVRVNPPHWLACAVFRHGVQELFLYQGNVEGEKRELEFLASDLDQAVRRAVR